MNCLLDFTNSVAKVLIFQTLMLGMSCSSQDLKVTKPTLTMDLSFKANPSEFWQIGYSEDNTLSLDKFRLSTFADTSNLISLWHPNANATTGYYPYVGQNRDKVSRVSPTNGWAVRSGQIPMEASNIGQFSVVRFVAPVDGQYKLKAVFEGVHFGLSTTDVHILLNAKQLFDDIIDGYGGDPAYHPVQGAHPSTSYQSTITMEKNDILTFAIGYGQNQTHFFDTTGLQIFLELL